MLWCSVDFRELKNCDEFMESKDSGLEDFIMWLVISGLRRFSRSRWI